MSISNKDTETEINQALEIARKVREKILFDKIELEKSMHGFFTIAQILNREEDLEWIQNELNGYRKKEQLPSYRQNLFRRFFSSGKDRKQFVELVKDELSRTNCGLSIFALEFELQVKDEEAVPYNLRDGELEIIKKKYPSISYASWRYAQEEYGKILSGIRLELIRRLNSMISEITYGKIPQGIFKKFQDKVNQKLVTSNPNAVSELNIAYESLGKSEDPERISHVAFACRRLIKAVADVLYLPQEGKKIKLKSAKDIEIGNERFLNRLEAYIDSIDSPNRKFLQRKLSLLRDIYGEIPASINKGTHLEISNSDAENLVIYTYIILGEIIVSTESLSNKS